MGNKQTEEKGYNSRLPEFVNDNQTTQKLFTKGWKFNLFNETKQFLGIYFRSTNAMSPIIKFNDDGTTTFRFITLGGKVEAYFMMQGSAKEII